MRELPLQHTCVSCSRQFPNNVALDRHRSKCPKRRPVPLPVAGMFTQNSCKHAHLNPPDVGNDGPSHSDLPEDTCPVVRSARSGRPIHLP
jgi:hypothetical protein